MLEWLKWWLVNTISRPVFTPVALHGAIKDSLVLVSSGLVIKAMVSAVNSTFSMMAGGGSVRALASFTHMVWLA